MRLASKLILAGLVTLAAVSPAVAGEGLVTKRSPHTVAATAERLEKALEGQGLTVVSRVDHAAGAQKAGLALRPTTLLVFGNPKVGTALIQSRQTIGIDLPLKALVWEDEGGRVWLAYNDPAYLAARHQVTDQGAVIEKMASVLAAAADAAVK